MGHIVTPKTEICDVGAVKAACQRLCLADPVQGKSGEVDGLVAQAAGSRENIEHAKRAAEIIISALFEHVGWDVKVTWQEMPTAAGANDAKPELPESSLGLVPAA